jgi:hypothetical protein
MMTHKPALEACSFALSVLLLSAFVGCKDSSKEAPPDASSATASAASAAVSTDTSTASVASDQAQAGDEYDDADPSALSDFHGALDSQGSWVDNGKYGTVWVPSTTAVGADFVPYRTGGHWAYGDDYTWVSDYDWGWAPFHYGRWVSIDGGWGWIPGRRYAPAWVTWRVGAPGFAYVGWAPLAPEWGWRAGVVTPFGFGIEPRFSFVGTVDLFAPRLAGRVLVGPRVAEAEAGTRVWSEGSVRGGRVSGPPPSRCGISPEKVAHLPPHDPAIEHAQNFGKPATAVALGGHPPVHTTGATTVVHPTATPIHDRPAETSGTLSSHPGGGLSDKPAPVHPEPAVHPEPVVHSEEHAGGNKGGKPPPEPKKH